MGISIDKELKEFERSINLLRVDFERFFSGDSKKAPLQARVKLQEGLRKLSQSDVDAAAERFRLQSIQSRMMALGELWDKRLLAREEGRSSFKAGGHATAGPSPAVPGTGSPARSPRPAAPVSDGEGPDSVKGKGRANLTPLFDRYCAARRALGEDVSRLKYERFEEQVRRQAEEIRRRTGAQRLVFEVQTAEGRVRLVGRPAPPKGTNR